MSAAVTPGFTPGPTLRPIALASTPTDPSLAIFAGLKRAAANGNPLPTPPRQVDEAKIVPFCAKKMRPTDVVLLVSMLGSPPSIDTKLDCIFGYSTSNKSVENQITSRALHHYLHHHARKDTEDTSANLRAILMVNSAQKDEDEHINNATFTYPMEPDGMYEAAEATILYYLNNPQVRDPLKKSLQCMIDESASVFAGNPDMAGQMISSTLILGRIFHSLITEKPISSTDTAIITEIAASLCFYQQSGACHIYHADRCSKRLASLLAVLRAGCCTALKADVPPSTSYEADASDFMKKIRSADTNSRIAQSVGHFRRLHQRTTFSKPPTTQNERGDVCIGNIVFGIEVLNNLIPTVNNICEEAISDVIVDDSKRWKEMLDPANRLEVHNSNGIISFKIVYPSGALANSSDIIPS